MVDIVDSATRSRMMSGIKGKNTKAEVEIRKRLFKEGYRYRLHLKKLPGKPDIVLPKYNAVIFINGCFWHAHQCKLFKWPSSKKKFWKNKLLTNQQKDIENNKKLKDLKWRVLVVWECSFRQPGKNKDIEYNKINTKIITWLHSKSFFKEIRS